MSLCKTFLWLSGPDVAQSVALALLVSCLIDQTLGEPAARWHPVVWKGQYLDFVGKRIAPVYRDALVINSQSKVRRCLLGSVTCMFAAISLVWLALQTQHKLVRLDWKWRGLMLGIFLKPLFSRCMLRDEVAAVEFALQQSADAGRVNLARLVSREVNQLSVMRVLPPAMQDAFYQAVKQYSPYL